MTNLNTLPDHAWVFAIPVIAGTLYLLHAAWCWGAETVLAVQGWMAKRRATR